MKSYIPIDLLQHRHAIIEGRIDSTARSFTQLNWFNDSMWSQQSSDVVERDNR